MKTLEELTASISALETKAQEATDRLEAQIAEGTASQETAAEVKALVEGFQAQLNPLVQERERALTQKSMDEIKGELTTLSEVLAELKKPAPNFHLPFGPESEEGKALDENYGRGLGDGSFSIYTDIHLANKGNPEARARLTEGLTAPVGTQLTAEGKAMTEGVQAQGGYLVRPAVERQLVEARELDNILRGLCSKLNLNTNAIQLDQLGLATTAGWVAELAAKPEGTSMTTASVTASVFTAAGLATISNQLLADSNPSVDSLVTADLVKRLVALEETAFLAGTGTGQPLGILNTPGLGATALTATDVPTLLTAILTAIGSVESNHGAPNAILMHPRTWTRILVAQMTGGLSPGPYIIGGEYDVTKPRTVARGPQKLLWGVPVYTTNRMPTNLGTGTNESRVIVGDFGEALILDRQGITVDESAHVYFTTNQTVFRAECRVGFTAARTPLAFNVVGGVGLAAG